MTLRSFKVPGIGFIGLGSQTRAAQTVFARSMGRGSTSPRKRRGKKKRASATFRRPRRIPGKGRTRRTRGSSRSGSKKAYMVKGSAAAKRHMAKLRRMRKK